MASVIKNPGKTWHVQVRIDGAYRKFYGFRNKRSAMLVGEHIEELKIGKKLGCLDRATRAWVAEIQVSNSKLYDRLARFSLVEPRQVYLPLEDLFQWYCTYPVGGRVPKAATVSSRHSAASFVLGILRKLNIDPKTAVQLTKNDVERMLTGLQSATSTMTARQYFTVVRSIFLNGVREGHTPQNPLEGVKLCLGPTTRKDHFFVTEELAYRILEALPTPELRVIWAMSRWGGVRVPSEIQHMQWEDLDFENRRIRIREPKKTSSSQQRRDLFSVREIPMFSELYKVLEAYRGQDLERSGLVLADFNWRETRAIFRRLLLKQGIQPWPKLFNSIRATRDTELQKKFPAHVVAKWLGHTIEISQKFYVQTTDADFEAAALE